MRSNRNHNHLTVADSSRGEFSLTKDDSRYIDQSFARTTHQVDPIDETTKLVRKYMDVRVSTIDKIRLIIHGCLQSMLTLFHPI